VQRLTGRPHTGGDAAAPPHRPCACRTIGGVGVTTPAVTGAVPWSQGYHHYWRPTTSQKKRVVVPAGGVAARRSISSPTLSAHARSRLPHWPPARVKKERAGERKVAYRREIGGGDGGRGKEGARPRGCVPPHPDLAAPCLHLTPPSWLSACRVGFAPSWLSLFF
jgi:hypothetical protein